MPDENIEIGVGVEGKSAVEEIDNITKSVEGLKDEVEGLADAESYLEQFDNAVRELASSFEESDPVFAKALEGLGDFASGNYVGAITSAFEAIGAAMEAHTKYVEGVDEAYVKFQTRIDPNGELAQNMKAMKGALAEAQREGGSSESAIEKEMEKIVDAQRKAAVRAQAGDGMFGAGAQWAGEHSGIVRGFFDPMLEQQAQQDVEHRKLVAQANRELAERNKQKEEREKAEKEEAEFEDKMTRESNAAATRIEEKSRREAGRDLQRQTDEVNREMAADEKRKAAEEKRAENEIERLEKRKDAAEEKWDRGERMKAITDQKRDRFEGGMDTSYDAIYNRLIKAGSASGKTNEEIAKEQDALRKEWHDQDMSKYDEQITVQKQILEKLGLK